MKEVQDLQHDPRFSNMAGLSEALKNEVATGRITVRAGNTLAWLDRGEQRLVAQWLAANRTRRIGPIMARRLTEAKARGVVLDAERIGSLLDVKDGRNTRRWVRVPLSALPAGMDYRQATRWVEDAIEYYKIHEREQ